MTPVGTRWSLPPAFDGIREIGTGASGVVHEATQRSTGRSVAVKVLRFPLDDDAVHRRFTRECAAMAALASHPNIVTIIDAGTHEGRPWIAMELCRRGSLAGVGPLDVPMVLGVLVAVADAMDAAHRQDVLHCDLKPANILTTDYGAPAVGDFGIARPASHAATTATGGYSLDHAAPEVLDGHEPTTATDVYCLGTTIWTLLSGHPPFRDDVTTPTSAIAKRILLDPFPAAPPHVPSDLAALVAAMTAKAPTDRIDSMAEVASRAREISWQLAPRLQTSSSPVLPQPRPPVAAPTHPAELTQLRPLRGGVVSEAPSAFTHSEPPSTALPGRLLMALTGVILIGLLVAGVIAAVHGGPSRTTDTVRPTIAPTALAPASAAAPPVVAADLGLAAPERDLACDNSYIVIIGSAVTAGRYQADVVRLLKATPGSHYLLTASSCASLADHTSSGDLIYAVYLGPFRNLHDACSARSRAGAIVRQLVSTPPTAFPHC